MKEKILYIWLQTALGICNRLSGDIFSRFNDIYSVYNCEDFSFLGDKQKKYINRLENKDTSHAFEILKRCQAIGASVTGYYDELYPASLRAIKSPPAVLYSIGDFKNLNDAPCIAVVGTRKLSDYGKEISENFSYTFSKSGAFVISGLAKGADVAAHRGAIKAGGYTVAVLGNPIGDVYPKENLSAFETLYKKGLVLSEMYPGCPRTRGDFPNRNRIISGISDYVLITEAGETSGALITAKSASQQGKPVFAVPGPVGKNYAGGNQLIKNGASVAVDPFDLLSPLSLEYPEKIKLYIPKATAELRAFGNANGTEQKVQKIEKTDIPDIKSEIKVISDKVSDEILKILKNGKSMTADEIAAMLKTDISSVMTELTFMEIDGSIISSAGGRFALSKA